MDSAGAASALIVDRSPRDHPCRDITRPVDGLSALLRFLDDLGKPLKDSLGGHAAPPFRMVIRVIT